MECLSLHPKQSKPIIMKKYLDPKADLTFKKVFGEHEDLVISFLNAMLPLEGEEEIKSVVFLNPELVPMNPLRKDSVVDVRCRDAKGRQFIVEMQMMWTSEYKQRVLFNASKAYVSQLVRGETFECLQPVYSLNMVNDTFSSSNDYYHDYRIVEVAETKEVIEGLRFIFIELPKFTPKSYCEKKMQVLWLRYLTEIGDNNTPVPQELLDNPDIRKAVVNLEEASFSEKELYAYDRFWDMVRTSRMFIDGAAKEGERRGMEKGLKKGMEMGIEKGIKKGIEKGMEKGIEKALLDTARKMKSENILPETISKVTGLSPDTIARL